MIAEVDAGEPVVIKELAIDEDETCAQLEERMHKLEWLAIVEGTLLAVKALRYGPSKKALLTKSLATMAMYLTLFGLCSWSNRSGAAGVPWQLIFVFDFRMLLAESLHTVACGRNICVASSLKPERFRTIRYHSYDLGILDLSTADSVDNGLQICALVVVLARPSSTGFKGRRITCSVLFGVGLLKMSSESYVHFH